MNAGNVLVDIVETEEEARRYERPPLIVRDRLEAALPGTGPVELARYGEGHSNVTFFVRRGDQQWILRRPPRPPYAAKAHDVIREYRFLVALRDSPVPTPAPVMACRDEQVIGAPFYVMEALDGHVIRDALPRGLDGPDVRVQVAAELVDTLVALHAVDWRQYGFPVRGDGERYLERQLDLWHAQWHDERARDVPEILEAGARLRASVPPSPPAAIVHGDYKLDNVIFAPDPPPRIVGVLDWEMATVGDPLADVGYLASMWIDPGEPADRLLGLARATAEPGFPPRSWLLDRYADRSGRDLQHIGWYEAFGLWKVAVLLEGSYRRYLEGTDDDPFFALLADGVPALGAQALDLLVKR